MDAQASYIVAKTQVVTHELRSSSCLLHDAWFAQQLQKADA